MYIAVGGGGGGGSECMAGRLGGFLTLILLHSASAVSFFICDTGEVLGRLECP